MAKKKSNWKIHGINLTSSDAIYQSIMKAITEKRFNDLRGIAGHQGPIDIDFETQTVTYRSF